MKYLFASDLHGSAYYCKRLLARFDEEKADRLVLLGDLLYHGPRNELPRDYDPKTVFALLNERKTRILAVRGNCDSEVDQMVLDFPMMAEYAVLDLDGQLLYVTHGHKSVPPLIEGDLLMNGHFHVPACERRGAYRYLNCGSLALPKEDSPHSYIVYEDGVMVWKDVDGVEFMRYEL